ncbi:hypothetical protein [Thiohalophilus sp.]|uniref:hypothetical protein n=1 Tax=Thiohalophilus sp. TaxID=3028392 RepID=UPI002ACEB466|nr:hypothetical protein [Thiohalophilus sp.]MDZ7804300.1 hypothetical protein [Thiohalophilus sp.]
MAAKNQQSGQKAAKVHESYKSTKANDPVDFDSLKGMSAEAVNQQATTWWRSHTSLHSQFASEANFAAYCRAHANNRVRIC